jgi:hypothetical protein
MLYVDVLSELSMVDLYSSDDSGFAEVFRAFEE